MYGPTGRTEGWQPIDAGHIGAIVKALAKEAFQLWMDSPSRQVPGESNWQRWERGALSMREKRILMTHVFGDCWKRFCSQRYHMTRVRAFQRTGCAATLTGANDNLISVDGLPRLQLAPIGAPFDDEEYASRAWSGHDAFAFYDELPGGDDEMGSSTSSSSSSSSEAAEDEGA